MSVVKTGSRGCGETAILCYRWLLQARRGGTGGSGSGGSGEAVGSPVSRESERNRTASEWKGFLEAEALDMGLQVLVAGWWGLCGGGRAADFSFPNGAWWIAAQSRR